MPTTFTDEMILEHAKRLGVEATREAVATYVETKYGDFVEGWEIRTGKPRTSMTKEEAGALIEKHPECRDELDAVLIDHGGEG